MSTNRIIFRYILGTLAEYALIAGAIYGVLWLAVRASDHLTAGSMTLVFVATFAGALGWMWWDSHHSAECGIRERREGRKSNGRAI